MSTHPPAPRPPATALRRCTPRSFEAHDPAAVRDALLALGAHPLTPARNELARLDYAGALALCYESGRIVVAGPAPGALNDLLDQWAAEARRAEARAASLFDLEGVA